MIFGLKNFQLQIFTRGYVQPIDGGSGGSHRVFATQHWGSELEGVSQFRKKNFKGEGADVGLLGWVGKRGTLELGNMSDEVPMDTEKSRLKKGGKVDSKLGNRFLKHELLKCN